MTWNHSIHVETRKLTRLDIALCDEDWRIMFPGVTVKHLSHFYLDYCPSKLQTTKEAINVLGKRPFRFQAVWMGHKEFGKWVE